MKITSLSSSMVETYRNCSLKFYYGNVAKLPRLASPFLALGASFHETVRENAFQKVWKCEDLPEDLLTDWYAEDLECRDVDWSSQTLATTIDQGVACVRAYRQDMAPKMQPVLVEHLFRMEVNGRDWAIAGKIDLITDKMLVIDHKTTKGQMKVPKPSHAFQIGVYTLAARRMEGFEQAQARIDYYPRGKPDAYSRSVSLSESLDKEVVSAFDAVATGIQREVWVPNRTQNNLCKRRYCDFWNQCEGDFGGRVAD